MREVKSKKIITQKEVEAAENTEYIVKTIIPYVKEPIQKTYNLTQEELNSFFEDYNLFAEFVISIKKLEQEG